jgi:hypothetical protein
MQGDSRNVSWTGPEIARKLAMGAAKGAVVAIVPLLLVVDMAVAAMVAAAAVTPLAIFVNRPYKFT